MPTHFNQTKLQFLNSLLGLPYLLLNAIGCASETLFNCADFFASPLPLSCLSHHYCFKSSSLLMCQRITHKDGSNTTYLAKNFATYPKR